MRSTRNRILSALIGVFLFQARWSRADESRWSYGAEADFTRHYIQQGLAYDRGLILQPSAWISKNGFTLSYWANNVIRNDNYSSPSYSGKVFPEYPNPAYTGFKEHDLSAFYETTWRDLYVKPMLIVYTGNRADLALRQPLYGEASVQLAYPVGPVKAYMIHTAGLSTQLGTYVGEFGIRTDKAVGDGTLTLSTQITVANDRYNLYYIGLAKTALNAFQTAASFTYPFGHFYIRPHCEFFSILDNELRGFLTPPTKPNTFNMGLAAGVKY